jgi:hypothetical protein
VITEPAPYQLGRGACSESYSKRGIDDPAALCLPPGVPRLVMVSLFPIEIVQTPKRIVFMYEYMNVFRSIPIGDAHPSDIAPTYLGDSVARWEGNTLVVDVVGFNDKTWLTGTGTFHSEDLHLVERYTRVSKDRIDFEATIDDPKLLTKPWTIRTTMMLREGRGCRIRLRREQPDPARRAAAEGKASAARRRSCALGSAPPAPLDA